MKGKETTLGKINLMIKYFLLPTTIFFYMGCTEEQEPELAVYRRTVLVYMGGDNNLATETDTKISALAAGWNRPDCRLVIYQDSPRGPCLLEVTDTGVDIVRTYSKENSASRHTLNKVVAQVQELYPSRSYGLLVFSHATGWLPQGMYTHPRSIITDGSDEMEISDFSKALAGFHFDFIIFETCLMAGVEVAWELREHTDFLVASAAEILSPGFTPVYPALRECLFASTADLVGFSRIYFDHYNSKSGLERSATISVIRTAGMQNLVDTARPILRNKRDISFKDVAFFDGSNPVPRLYSDLGDYLRLKSDDDFAYSLFERELHNTVIYQAATPFFFDRRLMAHSGFSIYIPHSSYPILNENYKQTSWYKEINK